MSDPDAIHDQLGEEILTTHERLTKTIAARLPAMPLEERERYFAVLAPLVAKLEEIEKPLRQVFREAVAELLPIFMQRFSAR
ncbi:MAG: hypothetical protein ABW298_17100 [Candidatus Binatia bacterium]|jgi:hypothetical protein